MMVVMGRVVAPYGIYGWLKVLPDTESMDSLFHYDTWWLGKGNEWREMVVETAKIHNDVIVVKLQGINDRDAAFACKGKQIAVPRSQMPEPDENEYYWTDLFGLHVKNVQGKELGIIDDILETGANDVLVIKRMAVESDAKNESQQLLVPFIASVVLEVDLKAKTMLVDWDPEF